MALAWVSLRVHGPPPTAMVSSTQDLVSYRFFLLQGSTSGYKYAATGELQASTTDTVKVIEEAAQKLIVQDKDLHIDGHTPSVSVYQVCMSLALADCSLTL